MHLDILVKNKIFSVILENVNIDKKEKKTTKLQYPENVLGNTWLNIHIFIKFWHL